MMDMHIGAGWCRCGQKIETTDGSIPRVAEYINGECVYAVCSHGVTIVDNRLKSKEGGR